ncbi:hypothetical protein OSB04_009797 [Centaurea solstitialis]|uniref:Uncharacterized protein n=1 Tax=Centaurea solstitialis TaxID=347529 RepID=A0AA38TDV2_9ASTR|nr:hypothetical protein OSB04_009797 [Centaurea solstitialis]
MHRQSLGGSPASKLINSHGVLFSIAGVGIIKDDINNNGFTSDDHHHHHHRKDNKIASSSSSSPATAAAAADNDDEHKSQKPYQLKSTLLASSSSSSRLVHLIPLLTFLCFLVLYLTSHDPSRRDLGGFTTLSSRKASIDSTVDIDNIGALEIEKSDVLAIRSMRNLQQQERHHHRLHRKFGH